MNLYFPKVMQLINDEKSHVSIKLVDKYNERVCG